MWKKSRERVRELRKVGVRGLGPNRLVLVKRRSSVWADIEWVEKGSGEEQDGCGDWDLSF